jgi:thiol-disulfide isomerase/thioredoxin
MNRREYVTGLLGAIGAGGVLYGATQLQRAGPKRIDPTDVTILRPMGTNQERLPRRNGLTLIDFFSTYCSRCDEQIAALRPIAQDTPTFLSIVSLTTQSIDGGFTAEDLQAWWDANGGTWPVGIDDGTLASTIGVRRLPAVVLLGPDGRVHWSQSGASTTAVRSAIEDARRRQEG